MNDELNNSFPTKDLPNAKINKKASKSREIKQTYDSDCGCAPTELPQPAKTGISRRSTLKLIGAVALAPAISLMNQGAYAQQLKPSSQNIEAQSVADEFKFIFASPMVSYMLDQLKAARFGVENLVFERVSTLEGYLGLRLVNIVSPDRRTHANVFCAIDQLQKSVVTVHMVMGQSLETALDVYSIAIDEASLKVTEYPAKGGAMAAVAGYKQEFEWSFPRDHQDFLSPPDILPMEGWPIDDGKQALWIYGGSTIAEWAVFNDKPILRTASIIETFSVDAKTREFRLPYPKLIAESKST